MNAADSWTPYGLQRDMLMYAERAADGTPVTHRYGNVWESFVIHGDLDVGRLLRAIESAATDLDSLQGRLVRMDGLDRLVRLSAQPLIEVNLWDKLAVGKVDEPQDLPLLADSHLASLRHLIDAPKNLQTAPLASVAVVPLDSRLHLLVVALDHSESDGGTLVQFVRQVGRRYRAGPEIGRPVGPLRSFWSFLTEVAEDEAQRKHAGTHYRHLLQTAGTPRARVHFPGGSWRERGQRDLTRVHHSELGDRDLAGLLELSQRWNVSREHVLLAATGWVIDSLNQSSIPIDFLRSGRGRRGVDVPGPFAEHVVTGAAEWRGAPTLSQTLGQRASSSASSPPYGGTTQREFENPGSEENLMVVYNFLPGIGAIRLGNATMRPSRDWAAALAPRDTTSRFGVRVECLQDPGRPLTLSVHSDPSVLPDPDRLVAGIVDTLATALDPNASSKMSRQHILQQWS